MLKKLVVSVLLLTLVVGMVNPATILAATSGKNTTWAKTTKETESNNYYDITYNKDKIYVVVGDDGAVVRSEDAKLWESIPLQTTENLNAIATNGQQFVAVGNNGIIIHSANGKSWARGSASFSASYTYEQITGKMRTYVEDNYKVNWAAKAKQSQLQFKDILWDGKKYVAIARWEVNTGSLRDGQYYYTSPKLHLSSNFILTSKDGKKWTAKYADVPDFEKIIYTGSKYTAISEESVSSSTDLAKWKTTTPDIRGDFSDIIYSNGKYLTIGWDGNISARTGTIYTSSDGVKWKAVINKEILGSGVSEDDDTYGKPNGFSDLIMYSVLWDGNQYVIAGYNGMILTSKSGTNWKKINRKWSVTFEPFAFSDWSGARANIQKIIYDGEQYIQVGNNGTILVSTDLKAGTVARSRPSVDFKNITYDGSSRYLAHGENDTIWESSTGYNWKQVELSDVTQTLYWQGIASYNSTAIAICQTKSGWLSYDDCFYYYSDRPGSWAKMTFPKKVKYVYDVKCIKDRFYVFTRNGIITSKDGKTWSGYSVTKILLKNITYNGKIYIGQADTNEMNTNKNALFTSSDCKKWSKVVINKDGKKYYLTAASVVWNGKQFVTIGGRIYPPGESFSGEKIVAFSNDGTTWNLKDGDDNYYDYGTYGNNTYIAIDSKGNLYHSTNGIDYTKSAKGTSQPLYTALWDGKKFLVAGEMGIILASTKDEDETLPAQDKWIDNNITYTLTY